MASILRSSKIVRYVAGFARNIFVNPPREFDANSVNNNAVCLCGNTYRPYASQFAQQQTESQGLEYSLKRIDQDVRKSGRISRRDIEDVLEEIRSNRTATSSQSLLVIRCCGNLVPEEMPQTRTKLVQEIWSTLNRLNVPMDISHYNALLRVYIENEFDFNPTDFLADLEAKGLEPNRVTYQRLISRYCQQGDIEGATKILEFMREKQMPVNENVFNALIVGHSQTGDMDSARGIISVMNQAGLEPSADTYTTLMCGYAKIGDIETVKALLEECDSKEIYLLDRDFLEMIYHFGTNGHSEHVPFILSKVRKAIGYNQDAINVILRLINKGEEDCAFLVLQSMVRPSRTDGQVQPSGRFFIRHLVKANRPLDKIIEICDRLESMEMHERALLFAAETSLELVNEDLAFNLLKKLNERGLEIRHHFFWPLIVANAHNRDALIRVLKNMSSFGVTPNTETIRDYILPNLTTNKTENVLEILRETNVSLGVSASSLLQFHVANNNLTEAAFVATTMPAFFNPEQMKTPLNSALNATQNINAYVQIIGGLYDNFDRARNVGQENADFEQKDVAGMIIADLIKRKTKVPLVPLLSELKSECLTISPKWAETIQDMLSGQMTDQISKLLDELSSGQLQDRVIKKREPVYTPSNKMNILQLERLIQNLDAKKQDTKGLKRQLLTLYYREKELDKVEKLLDELKMDSDFIVTAGIHAQLADLYAHHDKLEKALEHVEKIREMSDDGVLSMDALKILQISQALIKNDRFKEGLEFLKNTKRSTNVEVNQYMINGSLWRMMNYLAELGRPDDLQVLFDTLTDYSYMVPTNTLLGPLIKVHIVNNEIDKALDKIEWCVKEYNATPWKNEVACKLIQSEEVDKLQRLTDLGTEVHGEINSLYDLVFAFVECGRIRQARKILETPGLQTRPQRINNACERYQQEGLVKPLEGLKDATKDLNHIDRSDIYYQLMLSYIKQNEPDKALGLWTQMQEEDLMPTDQFLSVLGNYLKEKKIPVPFVVPKINSDPTETTNTIIPRSEIQSTRQQITNSIKDKIRNVNSSEAVKLYKECGDQMSTLEQSLVVEKLVQNDSLTDASKIAIHMIDKGFTPITRIFKFLLNKLANAGNLKLLHEIGEKIDQQIKKDVSYDNKVCHANLVNGNALGYLEQLEKDVEQADSPRAIFEIGEKFPRGGAYGILDKHPELVPKFEEIAIKYSTRGLLAPLNVLWTHYFINGNVDKADSIWKQYLTTAPRIMFQRIVHTARDNSDAKLMYRLIEHLKTSNVTGGALGNAYSCLLDVLVATKQHQRIMEVFECAIKDAGIETINRTALLRVKDVFEKIGQPFNYTIPPKTVARLPTKTPINRDEYIMDEFP